jgi:2-oxoisovalerate dehydrogenase E2 component (dihydrolipoyl transacylase)
VRHLLKKHNIRPELIIPTGKDKRILKEDVLRYINNLSHPIPPKHAQVPLNQNNTISSMTNSPLNLNQPTQHKSRSKEQLDDDKIVKLTGFKKAMTKTMTQSTLIPSFLYTDEFNVDKLVKLRQEMNKIDGGKIKFTYMPFFIKAVSNALLEFPTLNSNVNPTLGDDGYISEYTIKKDHNISIAIDSPEGLVVPNIKRVQDKSLLQIQQELYDLRDKAESRKLSSEDLKDGTFTISNIGNIGGKVLSPVILPPQVCIIGISKIFDSVAVVPRNGDYQDSQAYQLVKKKDLAVVFHKAVNLCISADHRIIDGATVARFSELLKTYVQQPLKIWTTST